jgi:hypothetical protein
LGRNGQAYFDLDTADYHVSTNKRGAGNRGRIYRNDGVDILRDSTRNEKYYVSHVEKGEWLQYTVSSKGKASYTLKINAASALTSAKLSVLVNGVAIAKQIAVPSTGSLKNFKSFQVGKLSLKPGKNVIRVLTDIGGYNFSYIQFIK